MLEVGKKYTREDSPYYTYYVHSVDHLREGFIVENLNNKNIFTVSPDIGVWKSVVWTELKEKEKGTKWFVVYDYTPKNQVKPYRRYDMTDNIDTYLQRGDKRHKIVAVKRVDWTEGDRDDFREL